MRYISTRDASTVKRTFSLEDALCSGYAPGGGLFVPHLPDGGPLAAPDWKEWAKVRSYPALMCVVLAPFVAPDIPAEDLRAIVRDYAFPENLRGEGNSGDIPVVRPPDFSDNAFVAELFHGPTFCFKDFGLRVVVGMLAYFAKKRERAVTLVVATTGDTGPAAVRAVQDLPPAPRSSNLSVLVHYPAGQISEFQRRQLTTAQAPNVKVVEFEGGGDDMDEPIKCIMTEPKHDSSSTSPSAKERLLCGINSYNVGRPLVQMVHFIWIYLRVTEKLGIEAGDGNFRLDLVVPTGAMGNLTGAYMAKQLLGLPLGRLCAGVNVNDFTHSMFSTGLLTTQHNDGVMKKTLSEAINIQLPYNLERILFYVTDQDHGQIKEWYTRLETPTTDSLAGSNTKKGINIGSKWLERLQKGFLSARVTDGELCDTVRQMHSACGYWADPHTGVALCAAKKLGYAILRDGSDEERQKEAAVPAPRLKYDAVAIVATASPCKFQEAMVSALGERRWREYVADSFPKSGLDILHKFEKPAILYKADQSLPLAENKKRWEQLSRNIIDQL